MIEDRPRRTFSTPERSDEMVFEIVWLGWDKSEIGIDQVRRYDLTDAISTACYRMKSGSNHGLAAFAHGFFVRSAEERG